MHLSVAIKSLVTTTLILIFAFMFFLGAQSCQENIQKINTELDEQLYSFKQLPYQPGVFITDLNSSGLNIKLPEFLKKNLRKLIKVEALGEGRGFLIYTEPASEVSQKIEIEKE